MCLVEFGDGEEVVVAGAGQVLLGEDVFEDNPNRELLSLLGKGAGRRRR